MKHTKNNKRNTLTSWLIVIGVYIIGLVTLIKGESTPLVKPPDSFLEAILFLIAPYFYGLLLIIFTIPFWGLPLVIIHVVSHEFGLRPKCSHRKFNGNKTDKKLDD